MKYEIFYLLIVGVDGYCCTWSHSMTRARASTHTQTHTLGRTPLDEGSARRRRLYKTQHLQTTNTHAPGWIRTRSPSKQAAADLSLRPCGHRDRRKLNTQRCYTTLWILQLYSNCVVLPFLPSHASHGVRGGAVGWGIALQAGRSRVR